MTLKAILFDFNGVIIDDEPIHKQLVLDLFQAEHLTPSDKDYRETSLGRSDYASLRDLCQRLGRSITEPELHAWVALKTQRYRQALACLESIPLFPSVLDCLTRIRLMGLTIGLVTGSERPEVELVLDRSGLKQCFQVMVTNEDITTSKPDPDGYLLALERLNQLEHLSPLAPHNCLVIEDTLAGIEAGKRAGMQVVGITNTYPSRVLEPQAHWTIDSLADLELNRVAQQFAKLA